MIETRELIFNEGVLYGVQEQLDVDVEISVKDV